MNTEQDDPRTQPGADPSSPGTGAPSAPLSEHTFLIAFVAEAADRQSGEAMITRALTRWKECGLSAWWVAEDDRHDHSDNDSAVWCRPGAQRAATAALQAAGLGTGYNTPDPNRCPKCGATPEERCDPWCITL